MELVITSIIYSVFEQNIGGNDTIRHSFYSFWDACDFAIANEGKIAYGLPTVKIETHHYYPYRQHASADYQEVDEKTIRANSGKSRGKFR